MYTTLSKKSLLSLASLPRPVPARPVYLINDVLSGAVTARLPALQRPRFNSTAATTTAVESPSISSLASKLSSLAAAYDASPAPSHAHDPKAIAAKLDIISMAKQVISSLMDGGMLTQAHSLAMAEIVCVRTLLGLKVFEMIPQEPGAKIGVAELSQRTGVQASLLERLLRPLVGTGFVTQTTEGEYGHTKFSLAYLSYPGLFFRLMHDDFLAPMTELPKYLKENGAYEPTSLYKNPYSDYFQASDTGLTTWDIMARDPERLKTFQIGLGLADSMVPTTGYYDFEALATDEPGRISLVDVGGGIGNKMNEILKASPRLKPETVVLQDAPKVIEMAEKDRVVPEGVKLMAHDFWTEQPVKGAKAYYVRRITHDYSDDACVRLLSHLRAAMAPDSKVLIAEQILPNIIVNPELETNVAVLDVATMVMGGKERTEEGFRDILDRSGLELVKIWKAEMAPAGVVEARIKAE